MRTSRQARGSSPGLQGTIATMCCNDVMEVGNSRHTASGIVRSRSRHTPLEAGPKQANATTVHTDCKPA
eukprot:3025367-Amphidinium_carterae.1